MPRILILFLGAILDNKNTFTAKLHIIKAYMSNSAVHAPFYLDCGRSLKLKEHLKHVDKKSKYVSFSLM